MIPVPVLHATVVRIVGNLLPLNILGAGVTVKILVGVSYFVIVAITGKCFQDPTTVSPLLVTNYKPTPSACRGWASRNRVYACRAGWSGCKLKWLPVMIGLEVARWIGDER